MRYRPVLPVAVGVLGLSLVACAGPPSPATDAPSDAGAGDHGAVAGATEVAEPPLGLTTIDPDGGVRHLDLLDESVHEIGAVGAPSAMTSDGRYLFAQTAEGVDVVDSGVWTWDHVDHFHYYRAEPRLLGTVAGDGRAHVATTMMSTSGGTGVFFEDSGEAVLLDTEALSKGRLVERFRMTGDPHAGMVVPVGSFALVTQADEGEASSVVAYRADGERTGQEEPCVDAAGTITTRVGAVIGCRDAALLATVEGDALSVERIPYPDGATAPAATTFANREGRPTVAGPAGVQGVWLLDTRARAWTLLPAPAPLVQVTAVDDDGDHVLALAADGRLLVMDGADGTVLAETAPLVAASVADGHVPALIADQQRAYLSGPVERRLFEIDFADGARIARVFETPEPPVFTAGTGR